MLHPRQTPPLPPPLTWRLCRLQIEEEDNDGASTSSDAISTTSLTDSILEYRTIHGRTYHHAIGKAEAWEPNDERHVETMDIK
jgi:hypothetical protein